MLAKTPLLLGREPEWLGRNSPTSHLEKRVRPHTVFPTAERVKGTCWVRTRVKLMEEGRRKQEAREETNGKKKTSSKGLTGFVSGTFTGV